MEEIYRYIAIEKQVPENAKAQTDRIWRAIKKLETFPGSHQDRLEGKYTGKGYKQLLVDNYMAIYKIDETEKNSLCHYSAISGEKYVKIGLASCKLLWYNNTAVCGSISSEDENKNLYTTFL